ncbi:uncharacterized protein LOC107495005 [Arachis duranensis]|uniref:Uncharacterized protein LOC107495005 n=1 Tax=Arachis duranensis TaxID=130453 RepID=A0A6P4DVC7_ARADU|nr:uncharacterized protein LOC107495005 [Arachis duranensis]
MMPDSEIHPRSQESVESQASSYQGASFPSPLNGVVIFVISTLGGYLQVRFQSKNVSPFEEHYQIMWAASMVLSLYSIMLIGEFNLEVRKHSFVSIAKRFTVLMGALEAVLLTIIIMPWFGYLKLVLWSICFLKATLASYEEMCQCFHQVFSQTVDTIRSYFSREEKRLPV